LSFILRMAGRELRQQAWRLLLIALCIGVGFAAFFTTYGFSQRVLAGIHAESRALLGADLDLSSRGLMPPGALARLEAMPEIQARTLVYDFPSMASTGQDQGVVSRLVEVRALDGDYPLAGRLETVPPRPAGAPWGLLVDASLAQAWGLSPGTRDLAEAELLQQRKGLRLGSAVVPVQAIVGVDDSRQASAFALGPRIYLGLPTAQALGLVTPRSRFSGHLLMTLRAGASLEAVAGRIGQGLRPEERLRLRTHEQAATALAQPLRNTNRFISQLGLFTLLLSSLGAWAILATYLRGREREAAILRCLGADPAAPVAISALIAAGVVVAALGMGLAFGAWAARVLPGLLGELIPQALRQGPTPLPPLLETGAAVLMLACVILPSLLRLRDVTPMALLRDAPDRRTVLPWICGAAPAAMATALVLRNAPSLPVGAATAGAMALLFLTLFGVSRLLLWGYRRSAGSLPLPLKLALGQLGARPVLGALLMSVIGLSVFLVLATQFVKQDLVLPLAGQQGAGRRPNLFFIDVQPDQIGPLGALLARSGAPAPMTSPMVRARLTAIAGRPVVEGPAEGEAQGRDQSMRTREQNLTWRGRLSESETVVAGRFWPEPTGAESLPQVSLEEKFAAEIGARLGDELTFDVQGTPLAATVTSLRRVRWLSFQPNFFIVAHPGLLRDLPAVWIAAVELDPAPRRALQNQVAQAFPNISAVDVGELAERIGRVLDLVALVTRALAALMLSSALLVLAASLLAARLGRQRDLALLRTLGASYRTLLASLAWEFLLLGGSAALGAGVLAWFLARAYSTRVLQLEAHPDPWGAALLILLAAVLTAAVGLGGSLRALRAKPMDVLRGE
jgi:putative ABC transport system permease protein